MADPHVAPKKAVRKITCYLDPIVHKALKMEAAQRDLSIGAIIEEALQCRVRLITRHGTIGSNGDVSS